MRQRYVTQIVETGAKIRGDRWAEGLDETHAWPFLMVYKTVYQNAIYLVMVLGQPCRSTPQQRRYTQDVTKQPADDDTDFWLAIPGLRESLIEAEADYAGGRTYGEDEIRARFGVPRRGRRQNSQ